MGLTRNSATLLGWKVASMTLSSATAVVLARFMAPEQRGALALLVVSISLVGLVCQLGVPEALIFTANAADYGRERMTRAALHIGGAGALIAMSVLIVLGIINRQSVLVIFASSFSALFSVCCTVLRHILLSQNRFSSYGLSVAIENVAFGILIIALFCTVASSVELAILAQATSQLIALLYCFKSCGIRVLMSMSCMRPEIPACRIALRHGLGLFAGGVCTYISVRLNLFLLQSFQGLASVGLYTVANSFSGIIGTVPQQIGTAIYSATASGLNNVSGGIIKLFRYATAISLIVLGVLAYFSEEIVIIVFGEQYRNSGTLMTVLTAAGLVTGLASLLSNALAGRGKTSSGLWGSLIGLVLGGIFGLLLIPSLGQIGAGIGAILASFAGLVVVGLMFAKTFEVSPLRLLMEKKA